ncbi:TIGR01777 family oxidoreductase [soil metagenome]
MRILVAGASGYIGTELVRQLELDQHEVVTLTRGTPRQPREHQWNPVAGKLDVALVDSVDAVIDLAGASLSKLPWTASYRAQILDSRLAATSTLTAALAAASTPPSVLLNASAVGYYGDRATERLVETSTKGHGFLADVVDKWEVAAHAAPAGVRVATFRTGIVVGKGGAFAPLELLTRFGLASRLGKGDQFWPWISLYDEAAAIRHLLTSEVSGAVNLAGPEPATSVAITRMLATAMGKWHPWVVPTRVIELALGTAGHELLLSSQKVAPEVLLADGFTFRHESAASAISAVWKA